MNKNEVLRLLESLGSAQTRKTYGRHGVSGAMFGVKYGDLGRLCKQIKIDHELALALWESGNHDARILASMVADPDQLTAKGCVPGSRTSTTTRCACRCLRRGRSGG